MVVHYTVVDLIGEYIKYISTEVSMHGVVSSVLFNQVLAQRDFSISQSKGSTSGIPQCGESLVLVVLDVLLMISIFTVVGLFLQE